MGKGTWEPGDWTPDAAVKQSVDAAFFLPFFPFFLQMRRFSAEDLHVRRRNAGDVPLWGGDHAAAGGGCRD